jgi:endothelin-converting enzyme
MDENVPASEQTPLLNNGVESRHTDSDAPFWVRAKNWFYSNFIIICLTIPIIVLAALLITLAFRVRRTGPSTPHNHHNSSKVSICTTPGCVLAASTLLRSISKRHKDLNPCDDFRTFSCEGFDAIHEIREDQTNVGSLQIMSEEGQLVLKRILESPAPTSESLFWTASDPDKEIFTKMQDSYAACSNESLLQSIGSKPLLDLLFKLEEIYPTKKPKGKLDSSLTDAVQFLMSVGVGGPIALGVGADEKDPDANVLQLSAPYYFGLPAREYYNNTDIVSQYKTTIGTVLEALLKEAYPNSTVLTTFRSKDNPIVMNKTLVDDLVQLEASMAAAAPKPEDASDVTKYYNPYSLIDAALLIPDILVADIITNFTEKGFVPSKVIVGSPDYLKSLSKILQSQDRQTIQAYLVWKVVATWGNSVEDDALKPLLQFRNKLSGKAPDVKQERWRTCVSTVGGDLGKALLSFTEGPC